MQTCEVASVYAMTGDMNSTMEEKRQKLALLCFVWSFLSVLGNAWGSHGQGPCTVADRRSRACDRKRAHIFQWCSAYPKWLVHALGPLLLRELFDSI